MMTSAQVVETPVNVTTNSPSQDYTHPDDHNLPAYDMTPGFKPFTVPKKRLLSFFTVEPRFNEPLDNEVLGITNDIFQPSNKGYVWQRTSI